MGYIDGIARGTIAGGRRPNGLFVAALLLIATLVVHGQRQEQQLETAEPPSATDSQATSVVSTDGVPPQAAYSLDLQGELDWLRGEIRNAYAWQSGFATFATHWIGIAGVVLSVITLLIVIAGISELRQFRAMRARAEEDVEKTGVAAKQTIEHEERARRGADTVAGFAEQWQKLSPETKESIFERIKSATKNRGQEEIDVS